MEIVNKVVLVTTAFVTICVLTTCRLSWWCLNELLVSHRGVILPRAQSVLARSFQFPGVFDIAIVGVVVLTGVLLYANARPRGVAFFASFCIVLAAITASISVVGILVTVLLCVR